MLNDKIIALIQHALESEAQAASQYQIHAKRIQPQCAVPFNDVADHLEEHADAEMEHYNRLFNHLKANGVEPKFGVEALINYGDTVADVVQAHQEAELSAIKEYKELMKETEGDEFVETNQLVQDILNDEIEHHDDFTRYEKKPCGCGKTASEQENQMSDIRFNTVKEAMQHLADTTGQKIVVAGPAPMAPTKPSAPPKPGKTSPTPSHTPGKQPRTVPLPQPKNMEKVASRELSFASVEEALGCFADMTNASIKIAKTMENFNTDRKVSPEAAADLQKSLEDWAKKHSQDEGVKDVANRIKKHLSE